jgi:hypothetical protein
MARPDPRGDGSGVEAGQRLTATSEVATDGTSSHMSHVSTVGRPQGELHLRYHRRYHKYNSPIDGSRHPVSELVNSIDAQYDSQRNGVRNCAGRVLPRLAYKAWSPK